MRAAIRLEPRLDLGTVRALHGAIMAQRGTALAIDAGGVTHLGALGLQVLLAAARDWRQAGQPLAVTPRSSAFDEALGLFGLGLDDLQAEPQT